jgi:hypothetical protein
MNQGALENIYSTNDVCQLFSSQEKKQKIEKKKPKQIKG